jgi:cell division protein ZapA (FtsZ GTPase activity inhibitor)
MPRPQPKYQFTPEHIIQEQSRKPGWGEWLSNMLSGKEGSPKFFPIYEANQQDIINQAGNQGMDILSQLASRSNPLDQLGKSDYLGDLANKGYKPSATNPLTSSLIQNLGQNTSFDPIEKRARDVFTSQTLPSIAERFSAMPGDRTSGSFIPAMNNAARDFDSQLAALRSQYQQTDLTRQGNLLANLLGYEGNQQDREQKLAALRSGNLFDRARLGLDQNAQNAQLGLNLAQLGLTNKYQTGYTPPTQGMLQPIASGIGTGGGMWAAIKALGLLGL